MTLQNQDSTVTHNGNGLTKVWPYSFRIPDPESLRVGLFDIATSALTLLTPSDFTVTGLGEDTGGEVTYPLGFIDAIGSDKRLVIYREVPYTQAIDLTNQTYYPETLEDQLDLIVMQIQKLAEESSRALKVTLGASLEPDVFIAQLQAGAAIATEQAGIATTQAAAAIAAAESVDASTIVHYTAETKTAAEQGQARANIGAGVLGGFRNKIINGDFDIWQRGITLSAVNLGYSADRWLSAWDGSGGTRTISKQLFPVGSVEAASATSFLTWSQSVAGTGAAYNVLSQRIEDVSTLQGKRVTVTFYAKSDGPTITLPAITLRQRFGTGGSPSAVVDTSVATSVAVNTNFARYSYSVTLPSILGKAKGTDGNSALELQFLLPLNSTFVFSLAHVSLVEGDATAEADPFSSRHIQQELALCQRYYETGRTQLQAYSPTGGLTFGMRRPFVTPKRSSPTITVTTTSANTNVTSGAVVANAEEMLHAATVTASGVYNSDFTWKADAEL